MAAHYENASADRTARTGSVQAALLAVLGVMLLATALNIGLAEMAPSDLKNLPAFLAGPYERGGRPGVTLAVICFGFGVIAVGLIGELLAKRIGCRRQQAARISLPADLVVSSQSTGIGSSFMELETSKYMPSGWSLPAPQSKHELDHVH